MSEKPIRRYVSRHALKRMNERAGRATLKGATNWVRKLPPGERVREGVFIFVFGPVKNGKQILITILRYRKERKDSMDTLELLTVGSRVITSDQPRNFERTLELASNRLWNTEGKVVERDLDAEIIIVEHEGGRRGYYRPHELMPIDKCIVVIDATRAAILLDQHAVAGREGFRQDDELVAQLLLFFPTLKGNERFFRASA